MPSQVSRLLILCKTYPSPSSAYVETSCVAAIDENGKLVRIYPMPFRLVSSEKQFKKWQWISARIEKSRKDHRAESHKVFVDTINCDEILLSTKNSWSARREHIQKIIKHSDFDSLENARAAGGPTLGIVRPLKIVGLDITQASSTEWTKSEIDKLISAQNQADLFDATDAKSITTLKKLPFDFHYRYVCSVDGKDKEYRHKIVDWEIGALFWNVRRSHGERWEKPFREKLEIQLPKADLMFLMGTIHRFPDQWLIVSLIYPPKQQPEQLNPQSSFDL